MSMQIGIQQSGVPYGLLYRRMEPGYLLTDGTVLLECERDEQGRYRGGAGMDGMYVQTGRLYTPVYSVDGQINGFREVRQENHLASAEMDRGRQIDSILPYDGESPEEPASIRERLRQYGGQADADAEEQRRRKYLRVLP